MNLIRMAALAALAALIAGCGGGATPKPSVNAVERTIGASEFEFAPKAIEASAGSAVKITIVNNGTLEHDFTIDALNLKVATPIGQTVSGTSGALAAGTYDFYCSVAGHKEAGMTGTLTVK